jgi:DNA-binding NarL/FixJ family response regulator
MGLALFLSSYPDMVLAGEAASSAEALALCALEKPDVVLMDLQLPDVDGLRILERIRDKYPEIRVLILTSYPDPALVERAFKGGANGYLLKDVSAYDLAGAIRAASEGRSVLANEATESLVQIVRERRDGGVELTKREHEVLVLIVEGLSNAEIAEQLNVSYSTVKFHVGRILSKLGAPSRAMAVTIAWQRHLVPRPEPRAQNAS